MMQLWQEFSAIISCDLPKHEDLRKTWDDLSGKIKEKAEIERGKAKLDSVIQQQDEEKALYSNEDCGKYDFRISCLLIVTSILFHNSSVSELCKIHCIELLVTLLSPRTKTGLTHHFEVCMNY